MIIVITIAGIEYDYTRPRASKIRELDRQFEEFLQNNPRIAAEIAEAEAAQQNGSSSPSSDSE